MANLHLVTGYAGVEHITSEDQGSYNAAIMGTGQFVLERGAQFDASIISNNKVRVFDGDALMQGRHIRMKENTYVDLKFDNGSQGYNRIDLIVIRYTKDSETDIEMANLVVIKGTAVDGAPTVPEHVEGDLLDEHDLINDMVLYKVPFEGLSIQPLETVFEIVKSRQDITVLDFNDTGEIEGIESFMDFMSLFVSGTNQDQFLAYLKAGLKYVLHMGMLVNNGTCETPGQFALDAAYGKTLTDMITGLYSEIEDACNIRHNPISNRIEVKYNGEWVNYPPSYVGNAIYLIQNGELLVPYTVLSTKFNLEQREGHVAFVQNGTTLVGDRTHGIRFDKNVIIDEPYELHLEAYGNTVSGVYYSGKGLETPNNGGYTDVFTVVNSGSGNVELGRFSAPDHVYGFTTYIKNLYFKRVREE